MIERAPADSHHEPPTSTREALTYRGEALRAVALPLGGIGTGCVSLAGDGGLRQWQIANNVNHDAHVPHSFFAIWAGAWMDARRNAVVLQSDALYDDEAFKPAPSVSDHLVPQASRELLAEIPGVEGLEITAQYPIADVAYQTAEIPVEVRLEAFSPFIPLNSKDSGLPVVVFNFTVTNPTDQPAFVSLMGAQQNLVGWDGKTRIRGARNQGYGGNVNSIAHLQDVTSLLMSNTSLAHNHPANGQVALALLTEPDEALAEALKQPGLDFLAMVANTIEPTTALVQWQSTQELWDHFSNQLGRLPVSGTAPAASLPSPAGQTWDGALATHFLLLPGTSRTITFLLAWHFPNRHVAWEQANLGVLDRHTRFWLGNQYSNWFSSALAVVEYVRDNKARLLEQTRQFRDSLFESTLPWEVIESAAAPVSTIRSPTCLWTADGRFHGFEGCHGASTVHGAMKGCCPMNCTHVWNYEMAVAKLFPDLERSMRETDLIAQMSPEGAIPHRTPLPMYLPRPWDEFIGGPRNPAMDGELGTVLKAYREVKHGAGRAWFDQIWPRVKRLMQHVMDDYDTEGDGVIRGEQPNTYDISIYGPNTFIGSLYLAALRATEEMAKLQDEPDLAQTYHQRFELGSKNYDDLCWNGEYYIQIVDMEQFTEQQFGTGCHVDQLLGQWWAHTLDLGHVLPEEHVKATVRAIFANNRRVGFDPEEQRPRVFMDERDRGLYICSWPHGGKPEVPTQYSDEVWSGLEYPVACLLMHEAETDASLTMLADIRDRHDGTRRSPWNEVECGDHYVRAMASWTLLEAASGYRYDAPSASLAFAPGIATDDFRTFFITGDAWGTFSQSGSVASIAVQYGALSLERLQLTSDAVGATARVAEQDLQTEVDQRDGSLEIRFAGPVAVAAGQTLTVSLS